MNADDIEQHILAIATVLEAVALQYANQGFSQDDIHLLMVAAEQLRQSRATAEPVKPLFKRVP
jgi:hypothetical protein